MIDKKIPLAEKMRPKNLADIIGQDELISKNSLLNNMIEADNISSFILWGPPGCGKTTIAKIIETTTKKTFIQFSAVLSSIKEIKIVMNEAKKAYQLTGQPTIIFIDEIHRFSKSQQDAFLPYVEAGTITLIGATTENPSFEVIPALLSRCTVFTLNPLKEDDLIEIVTNSSAKFLPNLSQKIIHFLVSLSGGDARKALNNLEMLITYIDNQQNRNDNITNIDELDEKFPIEQKNISIEQVKKILQHNSMNYDKNGEEHYNVISALHKSVRGSDPQAALYWLARMLEAGDDPMYIARRLVRIAVEDIGLADPNAVQQAIACKDALHLLGMPEADIALAQCTIYLATAPKSNTAYMAYKKAKDLAKITSHLKVPLDICNAPTKLMKELGYKNGYKYDHDYPNRFAPQRYLPEDVENTLFYEPGEFGFEREIKKRMEWWEKLKNN